MAYFSRLIFLILSFAYSYTYAYDQTGIGEGGQFILIRSSSVEVYTVGNGQTVWATTLGPGTYRCDSSLWGNDPAYGKVKGCRFTAQACEAPTVWNPDTSKCEPPPPPECSVNQELDPETNTCVCKSGPAGSFVVSGDTYVGCNDGCVIALTSGSYSPSKNKTYGDWRQTGDTCTPSPGSPGIDPPDSPDGQDAGKCPTGQCPGTFNGQFMCVPCKGKESSDSSSSENTTETPNGASAPSSSSSESSSGSKSTECEGGVCVTKEKVVVVNPDGSTTEKEKETTESISDFCAKNPKAAICKAVDEGKWGGTCSGGFQCSGDPVQCAQAREAAALRCGLEVDTANALYQKGVSGVQGLGSVDDPRSNGGTFSLSTYTQNRVYGPNSEACVSDINLQFAGKSIVIPLSKYCDTLRSVGLAGNAISMIIAIGIIFGNRGSSGAL